MTVIERRTSWSEEETMALGEEIGARLHPAGTLLLEGDLGAGKTILTKGLARVAGVPEAAIQSPTFTISAEHDGERGRLVHIDLYRLGPEDMVATGIEELLAGDGLKVVEWADRLPFEVEDAERWRIRRQGDGRRELLRIEGRDEEETPEGDEG